MNDINDNEFPSAFETALSAFNKEECLAIASSDSDFTSKEDLNKLHLAVIYLRENINSFDENEIKVVFSNTHFLKNIGDKFGRSILNRCIQSGISSPVIFKDWQSKKINKNLISSYLKIINDEENIEQLKFFTKFHTKAVEEFIREDKNVCDSLSEIFLDKEPTYIFGFNWSEEKVCNWLNNHKDILPNLALSVLNATFRSNIKLTSKIEKILLNSVAKKFLDFSLDGEEVNFKGNVLMNTYFQNSFFKKIEENYPNEYRKVLSLKVSNNEHPFTNVNLAQYTLLKRSFSSLNEVQEFFAFQKDILLEPIKLPLHLYDREVSIFEYGLEKSNFSAFAPFSLTDNLTSAHNEQIVAAAFCLLQCQHGIFYNEYIDNQSVEYNKVLASWHSPIIQQATNEQIYSYSEKIISNTNNEDIKKELEQLKLYRDLNNDLSNNGSLTKKHKL
jgi:hypothetical protein